MTDNEELENKIDALQKKHEFETKHDIKDDAHRRHPSETAGIGAALVSLGYIWQEGAFLGLWTLGALLTFVDVPKIIGSEDSKFTKMLRNHPVFYVVGGFSASLVFEAAGFPMPEIKWGLLGNIFLTLLTSF